jgi:Ca2+-binding RTX toxin-like protein
MTDLLSVDARDLVRLVGGSVDVGAFELQANEGFPPPLPPPSPGPSSGRDEIFADEGANTIAALAGDDVVWGFGGNDLQLGNDGADTLHAGQGNNTVFGGKDNDVIDAGGGNDFLVGNEGFDSIDAGDGNNTIVGGNDLGRRRRYRHGGRWRRPDLGQRRQ